MLKFEFYLILIQCYIIVFFSPIHLKTYKAFLAHRPYETDSRLDMAYRSSFANFWARTLIEQLSMVGMQWDTEEYGDRWAQEETEETVESLGRRGFSSVAQLCLTLCDPMDCSIPGLPVHHQLLELAQTHVHRVGDALPPSHPLLSPSPPTFNLSQHQGLFQWVSSLHQVNTVNTSQSIGISASTSVLPMNIQDWFPLGLTGLISLQFKGFSRVFSNTTVQKHQFFGTQLSF